MKNRIFSGTILSIFPNIFQVQSFAIFFFIILFYLSFFFSITHPLTHPRRSKEEDKTCKVLTNLIGRKQNPHLSLVKFVDISICLFFFLSRIESQIDRKNNDLNYFQNTFLDFFNFFKFRQ